MSVHSSAPPMTSIQIGATMICLRLTQSWTQTKNAVRAANQAAPNDLSLRRKSASNWTKCRKDWTKQTNLAAQKNRRPSHQVAVLSVLNLLNQKVLHVRLLKRLKRLPRKKLKKL